MKIPLKKKVLAVNHRLTISPNRERGRKADFVQMRGETLRLQLISLKGLGQSAAASAVTLSSSLNLFFNQIILQVISNHAVQINTLK